MNEADRKELSAEAAFYAFIACLLLMLVALAVV